MKKLIFNFKSKDTKKIKNPENILGGKGSNLAEMGRLGYPVPSGFTISTEACHLFYKNNKKIGPKILKQIKADQIPTIYAYNKIDLVKKGLDLLNTHQHIEVSAKEGTGTDKLIESIALMINPQPIKCILRINVNESKIRAQIYSVANVIQECLISENTLELTIEIDERNLLKLILDLMMLLFLILWLMIITKIILIMKK